MKHIKEMFKKQEKAKVEVDPIGSLVISMNLMTGDMKVVGNVLADHKLCLMMLVEAGHKIINNPVSSQEEDAAHVQSKSPIITH